MSVKGFTLIEVLIVVFITTLISGIFPIMTTNLAIHEIDLFESSVIHTQFISLLTHQNKSFDSKMITVYPIEFNKLANVHYAQTFAFENTELVMSLGTGRLYEKSQYFD